MKSYIKGTITTCKFLHRNFLVQERTGGHIQNIEIKSLAIKNSIPTKLYFRYKGKIKTFPNKQNLKVFITTKPALQGILNGVFVMEVKET